jgi:23S rRNA-/tRNA-specific pseudouridylate synthase
VGDALYSTPKARTTAHNHRMPRQFLHAASLTLNVPGAERRTFEATLAVDLVEVLSRLGYEA